MADDLDFELAESELFEAESPLARGGGGLVMPLGKAPPPGLPAPQLQSPAPPSSERSDSDDGIHLDSEGSSSGE